MFVTPEKRAQLHDLLDAAINVREFIEEAMALIKSDPKNQTMKNIAEISSSTLRLFDASLDVARILCGDNLKNVIQFQCANDDVKTKRMSLLMCVQQLAFVFVSSNGAFLEQGILIDQLADSLLALNAGETPVLLTPSRVSGRRRDAFTRAKHHLLALCWIRRLIATGTAPKEARWQVEKAYEESWDTIRKWEKPCIHALSYRAEYHLSKAKDVNKDFLPSTILRTNYSDRRLTLEECGQLYRDFISSPEKT